MGQIFGVKKKLNGGKRNRGKLNRGKSKKALPETREANLLFGVGDKSRTSQSDIINQGVQGILRTEKARRGLI